MQVEVEAVTSTPAAAGGTDESTPEDAGPPEAPTGSRRPTWKDPVVLVAAVLVLVPTVAAMASALRNPYYPSNDWALLELQVRAVGTGDTPLIGVWSRFGWDHPGPWPLYLMALPYRLVPAEHGLLFGASAVNFVAMACCAGLALRRERAQALVLLVGLAVLERGLGIAGLTDPWNPILPILPFALYCLLCIELSVAPRRWMLPAAVAAGSFVVQAHLGFAQPVVIVGAASFAVWYLRRRREDPGSAAVAPQAADTSAAGDVTSDAPASEPVDPGTTAAAEHSRPLWRRALPTAIVFAVLWAPVALDQVAGQGNVGLIVRWVFGDDLGRPPNTWSVGRMSGERIRDAAAWLLDPAGLWIGEYEVPHAFGVDLLGSGNPRILVWLPLALGGAVLLARRIRSRDDRWLVLATAVVAAAGVVATFTDLKTARGAAVVWPFRWVAVVSMLAFVALGWAVVASVMTTEGGRGGVRARAALRWAAIGVLVVLVAVPVASTVWRGTLGQQPVDETSDTLAQIAPEVVEQARDDDLVVTNSIIKIDPVELGLPVMLSRAGIDWIERDDPRAEGRPQLYLTGARALDGMLGLMIASGDAELLARSGPPGPGEGPEIVLVRTLP